MQTATILDVLEGRSRWCVVQGDALAVLATMPDECVDALVTDGPYSSGGQFRGDRVQNTATKYVLRTKTTRPDFSGDNRDQRSFAYWTALWLEEALRVARPGSPCALFSDWRQLPSTTDAIQAGGWVWRGLVPWDKTEACRPTMGRFAAQCEWIALAGPAQKGVVAGLCQLAKVTGSEVERRTPSYLKKVRSHAVQHDDRVHHPATACRTRMARPTPLRHQQRQLRGLPTGRDRGLSKSA